MSLTTSWHTATAEATGRTRPGAATAVAAPRRPAPSMSPATPPGPSRPRAAIARQHGAPTTRRKRCCSPAVPPKAISLVAWPGRIIISGDRPGDELLVDALEHHASLLPWRQLACAAALRVPLDERGVIRPGELISSTSRNTYPPVAISRTSALGTWRPVVIPISWPASAASQSPVPSRRPARSRTPTCRTLGCDYRAFLPAWLYGPDGIGVLWGRPPQALGNWHWRFGGEMVPHRLQPTKNKGCMPLRSASVRRAPGVAGGVAAIGLGARDRSTGWPPGRSASPTRQ